ncbi:MAG: hypothetical protein GX230_02335 [Lentisphaerae bacterium]|nr:hypothetical protein [Lentisphaerota bacterium]
MTMRTAPSLLSALTIAAATISRGNTAANATPDETWRDTVVDRAHIMSLQKWRPLTNTMPLRAKTKTEFKANATYTGIPYSNGGRDGRLIGFDINLRTFLAATENPQSHLYTKDLRGQRSNSAAFYGMACNVFVSYSLQLAFPTTSSFQVPPFSDGIERLKAPSAQKAAAGNILWYKGHIEVVTGTKRDADGNVTQITVQDSWPPTTRIKKYTPDQLEAYLKQCGAALYNITDYAAWRGHNCAENFLFPNYELDSLKPLINRTLLLDLGDWVAYYKGSSVSFNIMDRDNKGVKELVIKRADDIVEKVAVTEKGIITKTFDTTGDYTAHCVMADDTISQSCEFSLCEITCSLPRNAVTEGDSWDIHFTADNITPINIRVNHGDKIDYDNPFKTYSIWPTAEQLQAGCITVPGDVCNRLGEYTVTVIGENRYGRLKNVQKINIVAKADPTTAE